MNDDLQTRIAKARAAGYSDQEIQDYIASQRATTPTNTATRPTPKFGADATAVVNGKPTGEVYANDPVQLLRAAAQGATLGLADEGEALARRVFRGENFDATLSDIRQKNQQFGTAHPVMDLAAQVAGGSVTGGGLMKLLGKTPAVTEGMSAGRKVWETTKAGAKVGSATGAIAGAGSGEGWGDRIAKSVVGGVSGGILGGALGGITEGVANRKELGQALRDMTGRTTGEAAQSRALGKLVTDMERAGLSPEQIRERLGEVPADVPYTILDVGGQNVRDRGMAVASVPGKGKETISSRLAARKEADGERVVNAFKAATGGTPDEVNTTTRAMAATRDAAADTQYETARNAGRVLLNDQYKTLLDDPLIVETYGEVTDRLARAGKELTPMFDEIEVMTKNGPVTRMRVADTPSVETLDVVYRELRDKASSLYRSGASNRARDYKRAAKNIAKMLDDPEIGVPQYTEARRNFADASRMIDARKTGYRNLPKQQPEEIGATLDGMSEPEQVQARAGFMRDRYERVSRRGNRSAANAIDANEQQRAQNLAVAHPEQQANLAKRLDAEHEMQRTYNNVLVGSRTTPLKEAVDDLGDSQWEKAGKVIDVLGTSPSRAGLLKRVKDFVQHRAMAGRGEVAEQLGEMMTQGAVSRDDLNRLIDAIAAFKKSQALTAPARPPIGPTRASALLGYGSGRAGSK